MSSLQSQVTGLILIFADNEVIIGDNDATGDDEAGGEFDDGRSGRWLALFGARSQ